jgi:hypothetical protein
MADFIFYFKEGWFHILSKGALDHLFFIVVLCVGYTFSQWRNILLLVTAFTIGHSLTLFLSVLDIIRFNDKYVEFAIPCTIVVSAALNLYRRNQLEKTARMQYLLALLFGFIHGMGFANSIRFMLSSDQQLLVSLFSFNLGLESGQIFVVLLLLFFVWLMARISLKFPKYIVILFSVIILGLSFKMAIDRFLYLFN